MAQNSRIFVGPVAGGASRLVLPSSPFNFNILGVHATGRSQAMAETLLHVAYLKARGMIGSGEAGVSYKGAKYQDFKGSSGYVCAHRAIFNVTIMDQNLADLAVLPPRAKLRDLLIAPQAVTDPVPPPVNYGDRLFEIVAAEPTLQTVKSVLRRQPANQPVEVNMVLDAISELIFRQYPKAYEQAIDKARALRRDKGWSEFASREEPTGLPVAVVAQQERGVIHELRITGPRSPLVEERMNELEFGPVHAGPSRFGDLVDICLMTSAECAQQVPSMLSAQIKDSCAHMDEAATSQPSSAGGSAGGESKGE